VQSGDDRAVREGERSGAIALDRNIIAQHCGETVEVGFFVGH